MPLRRKHAIWGAVVLGGAIGLAPLFLPVCACTPLPLYKGYTPTSLGPTFIELATAQEDQHKRSGRYASSPAGLASLALPPETRIVAVSGSVADYRVQLDSGSAVSCVVSGGRTSMGQVQPFSIDCRRPPVITR